MKRSDRYFYLSNICERFKSPAGTGLIPQWEVVRDAKSGDYHREIVGYTNLKEKMNEEAKTIDLREMLKQVNEGTRKRVEGLNNVSELPKSRYEMKKNIENLVNYWDKNPLLRMVYQDKASLFKDLDSGVNVFEKVKKFAFEGVKGFEDKINKKNEDLVKDKDVKVEEVKKEGN